MEEDYCPIKTEEGTCGAGGECNHISCWEKMHYEKMPKFLEEKMSNWEKNKKRDEKRWRNK